VSFLQDLNDLQSLLQRADLLRAWHRSNVYSLPNGTTKIEFGARIGVRSDQHARPGSVAFSDAVVELDLSVGEGDSLDRIQECSAQVIIEGMNDASEVFMYALHFDRHDATQDSIELHSQYHWQVGGDRLEAQNFGTLLQLQGPRFPYHPIDPALLVDFVLGHFNGHKRSELMSEANFIRYPRILYKSQSNFVVPFFKAVYAAFNSNPIAHCPMWPSVCLEV
jgi:hypothetical protein